MKNSQMIGKMRKQAGAVLLGLLIGGAVQATVVNLDFGPSGQTVYSLQGALPSSGSTWNNGTVTTFGNALVTFSNLTASDGSSTPWDVSIRAHGALSQNSGVNSLLGDFIYSYRPLPDPTSGQLTISGLTPNLPYRVYLYNSFSTGPQGERFILGSASDFSGGITNTVSARSLSTVPTDITGSSPVYSPVTDFAAFTVNADGSGNIYGWFLGLNDTSTGGHLAGLQITEWVPEPSTVMLLGLGGLLAWRRMRK